MLISYCNSKQKSYNFCVKANFSTFPGKIANLVGESVLVLKLILGRKQVTVFFLAQKKSRGDGILLLFNF